MVKFGIDSNMIFDKDDKSVAARLSDHDTSLDSLSLSLADIVTVNIKNKGAIGNGVTDCTTALQNAHDSLPNGGIILLPPGRYNFSTLNITNKYITITGSGVLVNGTIVVGVDGLNQPFIDYHLTIDGVRFERDTESNTVNAIEFQRAYWCKIKNCYFEGYNACIYPRSLDLQGNTQTHTVRIVIDGCTAEKINYLVYVPFNISGGTYGVGDLTVINCNPVLAKISAISARGVDGILVSNNTFTIPTSYTGTSTLNTTKAEVIYIDTAAQIVITGNEIFEAGKEGIHLRKTQFFTVIGNNIVWPGQLQYADGVRISGGDPSNAEYCIGSVIGNIITFPTRRGISIEDNCGHISINGNTIRDAGNTVYYHGTVGTNTPYGIRTEPTTNYITSGINTLTGTNTSCSINGANSQSALNQDGKIELGSNGIFNIGINGVINFGSNLAITRDSSNNLNINTTIIPSNVYTTGDVSSNNLKFYGDSTRQIRWGTGDPNTAIVVASVGSIYLRTDGGATTTLYIKESGTGGTGWVSK